MTQLEIQAKTRTGFGKGYSRSLRRDGKLPAPVYGKGYGPKSVEIKENEVEKIYRTGLGVNSLIKLNIEGDDAPQVMIKDVQGNAINRRLIHVDFIVVKDNEKVTVSVPVRIEGRSIGVIQGGVREQLVRSVKLLCAVGKVPEEVVIDVTKLGVGQKIHLSEVNLGEGIELLPGNDPVIVTIGKAKRGGTAEETIAAADAGADGEAPAEGGDAAPAEGDDAKPAE